MNWRRAGVAALVAVPIIALLGWGLTRDPRDIPSPLPGREAPAFAMPVFAAGQPPLAKNIGDTVSLAQYTGQVVVLNFWASWCLACRDEHRVLSDVALQYAGKPVHFIGVLYNDDAKSGTDWIANMGSIETPGPVRGYSGFVRQGARSYYCDYVRYPNRSYTVDRAGRERCRIAGWRMVQQCR